MYVAAGNDVGAVIIPPDHKMLLLDPMGLISLQGVWYQGASALKWFRIATNKFAYVERPFSDPGESHPRTPIRGRQATCTPLRLSPAACGSKRRRASPTLQAIRLARHVIIERFAANNFSAVINDSIQKGSWSERAASEVKPVRCSVLANPISIVPFVHYQAQSCLTPR